MIGRSVGQPVPKLIYFISITLEWQAPLKRLGKCPLFWATLSVGKLYYYVIYAGRIKCNYLNIISENSRSSITNEAFVGCISAYL